MSTSGSFTPAAVPECPYDPLMTRAAAQALATAGGLLPNCVVIISDGPTIGTAGNTSPTLIELNPVSATEFGQSARVSTTFATEAWAGLYSIVSNKITRLTDDWGNTAVDIDGLSPTVHTQVPWHLGNTNFRDNYFEDAVLTGFPGTGSFTDNRVVGSTLDFTGKTVGDWTGNEVTGGAVITSGANMTATRSTFTASTVSNAGADAVTFTDSSVLDTLTTLTITAAATGTKRFISGTVIRDRWRMNITGTANVLIQGSTLTGRTPAGTSEAELGGAGAVFLDRVTVHPNFNTGAALNIAGDGSVTLVDGDMRESRVLTAAGSTSTVVASTFTFRRGNSLTVNATGTGSLSMVQGNNLASGGIVQSGAAPLAMNACNGNVTLIGGVSATRGVTVTGCSGQQFTVNANGTGSAVIDEVLQSSGVGTTVININSSNPATPAQDFVRLALTNGSVLNIEDPSGAQPVDNSTIQTQSTVNVQPGGTLVRCRIAGEATLNTGAFSHVASTLEIQGTTTSTGANVNRRRTVGYSDWI